MKVRAPNVSGPGSPSESSNDDFVRNLVDAAPDAIVMVDEGGRMLLVNRRTEELFGYDRGQLLGRSVDELLPDRFRAVHRAHRTRYRVDQRPRAMGAGLRLFGRHRDGTEFPVEISLSPLPTEDGVRIVAAVRDVSERLRAEADQQRAEQELRVFEARERISRDLHDVVIQRLFAAGIPAQALVSRVREPDLAARAATIVDELDRTIRKIRTVIFGMQMPGGGDDQRVRSRISRVIEGERAALGFAPRIAFDGNVDGIPDDVTNHVLAILREALSNVARHAHASRVEVTVAVDREVRLRVTDDGTGMRSASASR